MSKINLLVDESDFTILQSSYLEPIFTEYFNIVAYDQLTLYNKADTIVVTNSNNSGSNWYNNLLESGFKILIDNLWEFPRVSRVPGAFVLTCQNWFWYNESLWYEKLGYNTYTPFRTYNKLAFMPMRLQKAHRDKLFESVNHLLHNCIYSYNDRGYYLPDDGDPSNGDWQRYFNPSWYDNTCLSLVAETGVRPGYIFITEKTFKPIAFYHPFLILGQPGTLSYIKTLGFETFPELFNENYDTELDLDARIQTIVNNLDTFEYKNYDKVILDKLDHNHNLFFNKQLVIEKIKTEVINPILEYAET